MYRAIKSLAATLSVGENYFASSLFDTFRYAGASLSSDERMLPPNLRGYAPEVSGIARTNAKVTVSQQGRILYQTTVASGPFRIQELSDSVSGRLDVSVEEQDGTVQTFQVDTAAVPYLTRPGAIRYKTSVGQPSTLNHGTEGPVFASGEFSWGSVIAGHCLAGPLARVITMPCRLGLAVIYMHLAQFQRISPKPVRRVFPIKIRRAENRCASGMPSVLMS